MIVGIFIGIALYFVAVALLLIFMYGASGGKGGEPYE